LLPFDNEYVEWRAKVKAFDIDFVENL